MPSLTAKLINGHTYYYAAFAHDGEPNHAPATTARIAVMYAAAMDFDLHEFLDNGVPLLDARIAYWYFANGISPAMVLKMVGVGSQCAAAMVDSQGKPLDGSKTYKVHLPPNVPVKDFWSFVIYDNQTRTMLQTDQQFPSISSNNKGIVINPDTSIDIWFGPTAPAGHETNWLQTIPGKGWFTFLRLYGPLQSWFDKTWQPGEIELMKS